MKATTILGALNIVYTRKKQNKKTLFWTVFKAFWERVQSVSSRFWTVLHGFRTVLFVFSAAASASFWIDGAIYRSSVRRPAADPPPPPMRDDVDFDVDVGFNFHIDVDIEIHT